MGQMGIQLRLLFRRAGFAVEVVGKKKDCDDVRDEVDSRTDEMVRCEKI
jgi:putative intracellular protease/amidase